MEADNLSFVEKVDYMLGKEPTKEAFHVLLSLSTPTLTAGELLEKTSRKVAMDKLIDEVSALNDSSSVKDNISRLGKVIEFIDRCESNLKKSTGKRKANPNSPPASPPVFPDKFHVHNMWPFLNLHTVAPCGTVDNRSNCENVAIRCMNARGTIAHGQQVETPIAMEDNVEDLSVTQIFDKLGGGTKHLTSVKAIQQELMEHGPVVSTSFVPCRLYPTANHPVSLIKTNVPAKHAVLIVGWEVRGFVEMWLVQRISNGSIDSSTPPFWVGFRSFGIDDHCVAPKSLFENHSWQHGPHFDALYLPDGWMQCPAIEVAYPSIGLQTVDEEKGLLEHQALVVRDKKRIAHSRRYRVTNFRWLEHAGHWDVSLVQVRDKYIALH